MKNKRQNKKTKNKTKKTLKELHIKHNKTKEKEKKAKTVQVFEIMYVMCQVSFFVKAIVFLELFKAITFDVLLIFRISPVRLIILLNFFSLDL